MGIGKLLKLIQWVSENFLTANADKSHLIASDPNFSLSVKVDKYTIANIKSISESRQIHHRQH